MAWTCGSDGPAISGPKPVHPCGTCRGGFCIDPVHVTDVGPSGGSGIGAHPPETPPARGPNPAWFVMPEENRNEAELLRPPEPPAAPVLGPEPPEREWPSLEVVKSAEEVEAETELRLLVGPDEDLRDRGPHTPMSLAEAARGFQVEHDFESVLQPPLDGLFGLIPEEEPEELRRQRELRDLSSFDSPGDRDW